MDGALICNPTLPQKETFSTPHDININGLSWHRNQGTVLPTDGTCDELTRPSDVNGTHSTDKGSHWNGNDEPNESDGDGDSDNDHKKNLENQNQKQSQLADTLHWLSDNYERAEGVCLPRCVLYTHYLDFCKKRKFTPAGAATFGKIIRQRFPKLTTRRLGTRGQSKYHYYGIGIKESSIYYHSVYSGKGLTRFSGVKIKTEGSSRKYSLSSKSGTLLPEFPESSNLILPEGIARDKVYTFIMMYRTHCQRILDTVIGANFDEVQNFYLHFWQGMPDHLVEVLEASIITDIVGLCDSILYKVLIDVLIPSTIQDLPDSLNSEIKLFVKHLPYWLENSLEDVPKKLREKKMEVVKSFSHNIKRQLAFVHLAQTTRSVLQNHESVNQMIEDLAEIDFNGICSQAAFTDGVFVKRELPTICEFFEEFQDLLIKQAPIESFTEWMDNLIDRCVLQASKENSFMEKAGEFLRHWSVFGSLIMRDLTLQSASSFGSFHLLHMMFDEYVFLVVETQQATVNEQLLQKSVQKLMKNAGEISMLAKVRCGGKDKNKKRKSDDDTYENQDGVGAHSENRPHAFFMPYPHLHGTVSSGTAFSRPNPNSGLRDKGNCYYGNERFNTSQGHHLPLPALKHYSSLNERPYFPHRVAFGGYADYVGQNNSFGTSLAQTFSDTHSYQGINTVQMQQYWNEAHARSHPHGAFSDPYSYTGYGRYNTAYDAYSKNPAYLRGHHSGYQDFNRNTFDDGRHFYSRAHDGLSGGHIPMNSYGSSFMEIAPSGHQEDMYQSSFSSATQLGVPALTHAKSYIPTYR